MYRTRASIERVFRFSGRPNLLGLTNKQTSDGRCVGCLAVYGLMEGVVGEEGFEPPTSCV